MNYIISIINPDSLSILMDLCNQLDLPLSITMAGRGTAVQSMLDLLGIESNERRIVFTVANEEKTKKLIQAQKRHMHIGVPGHGIVIAVPIKSVGGGTTAGPRVNKIALDAELHGASAVVLNAPTKTKFVQELASIIDIPIVLTVVSTDEPLEERMLHSGASIINVSGGKKTVEIIKALREIDKDFPIIATGGPSDETIREVIKAGANAVTYTPPTNGEIFKEMMERYRIQCSHHDD